MMVMRQITKTQDALTKKNIINRISDVPGGISIVLSTLVAGNIVLEGTPLAAPVDGKREICKQAKLLAGSTTTVFRVESGTHHFKVGENAMQVVGGAAYAITLITVAAGVDGNGVTYDEITVGTALESGAAGTFIYQSSAAGAAAGALTNEADTILKEAFEAPAATEIYVIYMADAFVRADVVEATIGALYLATLNVSEVKY
jgi:hypothetical protein